MWEDGPCLERSGAAGSPSASPLAGGTFLKHNKAVTVARISSEGDAMKPCTSHCPVTRRSQLSPGNRDVNLAPPHRGQTGAQAAGAHPAPHGCCQDPVWQRCVLAIQAHKGMLWISPHHPSIAGGRPAPPMTTGMRKRQCRKEESTPLCFGACREAGALGQPRSATVSHGQGALAERPVSLPGRQCFLPDSRSFRPHMQDYIRKTREEGASQSHEGNLWLANAIYLPIDLLESS